MIRLHYHPFSTYARRVLITLLEKGLKHEAVIIDMAARQHRSPEYLALNPYGRVPTLEEDGLVLYESSAILQYLEATHPQPALTPPDAKGRALVDMHLRLCDLQMASPTGTIIFPKRFMPKERWDMAAIEAAQKAIIKHLAIVEQQLGNNDYLVGNTYSLADIAYIPFIEFLPLMEITPGPAVAAWRERLLARPSSVETRPAQ
ncbi:glutathione S-transferase family protein [Solimonas terrae]|uniref:Glutathione S-transferase family protein n=1 Tax=Solimonas terrae TaxID=1396819 RepID=A0A6M2BMI6_9GAMM|nr:glutathione S-transferase family protein [Solimonas terrae]NGY03365.1 glutathione S-transferase family protein [Solimonas terrae]